VISDYESFEKENNVKFYWDEDEITEWNLNKLVLHIELRKWADIILLAPLSANTLAKITNGICDNLLV
jgi:phosphopantothenoylcysteine decarboxylase